MGYGALCHRLIGVGREDTVSSLAKRPTVGAYAACPNNAKAIIEERPSGGYPLDTLHSMSQSIIRALYVKLSLESNNLTVSHFNRWFAHWELVHGTLERKRSIDREHLAKQYALFDHEIYLPQLLFCIETYYVVWMKFLAFLHLSHSQGTTCGGRETFASTITNANLQQFIEDLLSEDFFRQYGLQNYGGGNLFDWFVDKLDHDDLALFRADFSQIAISFAGRVDVSGEDILRAKYHALIPKQARHGLGAYYTPEWLADYLLETLKFPVSEASLAPQRVLDPTCGSGTFLVVAIRRLLSEAQSSALTHNERIQLVLGYVVGIDINPIAVLAAKSNLIFLLSSIFNEGMCLPDV